MADLQISQLPSLAEANIAATDEIPLVDVSASETKKVTAKALVEKGVALIDAGSIPGTALASLGTNSVVTASITDANVTTAKIANAAITATQIADATITGAKLVNDTITATQIAANAVGASELADNAVDEAAIASNAVTVNKIANTTVTYAKLNLSDGDIAGAKIASGGITATQLAANSVTASELADNAVDTDALAANAVTAAKIAANTITANEIAANAVGASELADNAVDTAAIADGAVTAAKLSGTLAASSIADDAVTTAKIVDDAVTSAKLAANAVDAAALANNAVDSGAIASAAVIEAKLAANAVTNGKIADATITPAKLNSSNLDRSINIASGNLGINNVVSAATRSGISYNAQGLITGTVALAAGDLPIATASAVGGVSVGSGLSVSGAGALSLTNSVTGATVSGITFNNQGMITAATALVAGDLPVATTSAKGAVQITSGGGLTVDGSGNLITSTSGISAGTYQSITVNNKGVATGGAALTASLIPDLAASKITSGSLDAARIGNDTIDGTKLSNASTAIFQSIAQSGYPTAQFNGQILFDTVSEDAFIYDGNAWQAITTLTKGSLVFGGTYNANTSKMASTTTAGIAAGLAVGSNLPSPSSTTDGVYVVVDTAGTAQAPAPVVAFSPPDYILGVTNSSGSSWNEIDLSQTVAGQVASNITFTPYGQLSSTNVQDAMQELETEKLAKAGGEVTGQILISNTGSLVFEGSTVDAYETTLTVADPTSSDKTITFPDTTGTVITSGDTNTVTSTMVDASLVNANLAAGAAIAFSKLAALTSAQILVGNGSNVATAVAVTGDISINNAGLTAIAAGVIVNADISGSAAITGSKITTGTTSAVGVLQLTNSAASTSTTTAATPAAVKTAKDAADAAATTANAALPTTGGTLTGNLLVDNDKEVRFFEADSNGSTYVGIKGATDKGSEGSYTISLPASSPLAGQILKANASTPTTLEWGSDSATDSTKMPLAGGTFTGDVQFNGDSSNGLWDKSASAFVANLTGNASGSSGSCTGNAATATQLATARNSGGVSCNGTAAINLPGVNTAGNQNTSGTAAVATAITIADESSDTTCFPLFATAATGDLGAKSGSNLTFNSNTGALTATSFVGALTGNVTGNASGSAATVTGAAQSAITSLGTLTGLTVDGDVQFSGASYNLVWDKSDNALEFADNAKLKFGDSGDLLIYHNATTGHTQIEEGGSGNLNISGANVIIQDESGTNLIHANNNGSVDLYNNGTLRLATTSTGATVSGALVADGLTVDTNTLHVDATNNRVGIGEASPTYKTEIKVTDTTAYSSSSFDDNQHQLRLNNAGVSGVAGILLTAEPSSGSAGHAGIRVIAPANGSADMTFSTRNAGTFGERMRIDSSGKVGIGVTPLKALHVKSTGAVLRLETTATTGSNYIDFNDADENKAFIGLGSGSDDSLSIWNVKNDTVRIATNNTERVRIDSSGNLLVGRTTTYWNSRAVFQEDKDGRTQLLMKNDNNHADASACIAMNAYGNSWTIDVGSSLKNSNALTFNLDAASATPTQKLSIATNGNATFAGTVTATSFSGSGANLTNLPASGGTITGTASGSIADKAAVIVKSDGNLTSVVGNSSNLSSRISVNSYNSYPYESCFDSNSNKVVLSSYKSVNPPELVTYVGTVSGNSISWGSEVEVSDSLNEQGSCIFDPDNNLVIYTWTTRSTNRDLQTRIGTVSGTSMSMSSATSEPGNVLSSGAKTNCFMAYETSSNKVILFYNWSSKTRWEVGTVGGSTGAESVTWGGYDYVYDGASGSTGIPAADNVNGKIFNVWRKNTTSPGHGIINCGTISGNTYSKGSDTTFTDSNDNVSRISATYHPVDDKVLVLWTASNGNIKYNVCQAAGSSTTISMGSEGILYSGSDGEWARACYDATNQKITVRYSKSGGDIYFVQGSFGSGNTITWETPVLFSNGSRAAFASIVHDSNAERIVTTFRHDGTSDAASLVWQPAGTNLSSTNFVGFANGAVSNGQTATVNVVGNTVTKSSLTPGSKYYVTNSGGLSTTAEIPSVEAGLALTSTKLLIK